MHKTKYTQYTDWHQDYIRANFVIWHLLSHSTPVSQHVHFTKLEILTYYALHRLSNKCEREAVRLAWVDKSQSKYRTPCIYLCLRLIYIEFPIFSTWMRLWLSKRWTQLVSTLSWKDRRHQIYNFAIPHFTVQCTCSEKIHIFTFEVKIDHQLIISPGPQLQRLKWLLPPLAYLKTGFVLKTRRMAVLKERV